MASGVVEVESPRRQLRRLRRIRAAGLAAPQGPRLWPRHACMTRPRRRALSRRLWDLGHRRPWASGGGEAQGLRRVPCGHRLMRLACCLLMRCHLRAWTVGAVRVHMLCCHPSQMWRTRAAGAGGVKGQAPRCQLRGPRRAWVSEVVGAHGLWCHPRHHCRKGAAVMGGSPLPRCPLRLLVGMLGVVGKGASRMCGPKRALGRFARAW